jgi:hypothetical protein
VKGSYIKTTFWRHKLKRYQRCYHRYSVTGSTKSDLVKPPQEDAKGHFKKPGFMALYERCTRLPGDLARANKQNKKGRILLNKSIKGKESNILTATIEMKDARGKNLPPLPKQRLLSLQRSIRIHVNVIILPPFSPSHTITWDVITICETFYALNWHRHWRTDKLYPPTLVPLAKPRLRTATHP